MFQLDFHFVQVVHFVFGGLELFASLLVNFSLVLLLFVQFVDQLVLVGNFVVQIADLVILRRFVLLGFLEVQLEVFDVFLQTRHLLFEFLLVLEEIVPRVLLFFESVVEILRIEREVERYYLFCSIWATVNERLRSL